MSRSPGRGCARLLILLIAVLLSFGPQEVGGQSPTPNPTAIPTTNILKKAVCVKCTPGTSTGDKSYSGWSQTGVCNPCPQAWYTADSGASECQSCPSGQTTPGPGSSAASACAPPPPPPPPSPGSSSGGSSSGGSSSGGSSSGGSSSGGGSPSPSPPPPPPCLLGQEQSKKWSNLGECVACSAGFYGVAASSANGQPTCAQCPTGSTTSVGVTGATTADACDTETCPPGSQVPPPPSPSSTPTFAVSILGLGLIAGASAIVLGVVVFFFCCRKKRGSEEDKSSGLANRERYDVELSYPSEPTPSPYHHQYPAPVRYAAEPEQYPEYPEAWEVDSRFPTRNSGSTPPPPPSSPSASPGKRNLALTAARVQPRVLGPATTRLSGDGRGSFDRSPRASEERNSGGGRGPGRIVYR